MSALDTMAHIATALAGRHFRWATEADLQEGVALAFAASTVPASREEILGDAGRCDFFVPTLDGRGVAVELKTQGSQADIIRQLHRYACVERVAGVLLVSTSLRLRVPDSLADKPVRAFYIPRFS